MNNSIWFYRFLFILILPFVSLSLLLSLSCVACFASAGWVAIYNMPIGWYFHRNKFFYFSFTWNRTGAHDVPARIGSIEPKRHKCLWMRSQAIVSSQSLANQVGSSKKLMDQMLRLEYFMQIIGMRYLQRHICQPTATVFNYIHFNVIVLPSHIGAHFGCLSRLPGLRTTDRLSKWSLWKRIPLFPFCWLAFGNIHLVTWLSHYIIRYFIIISSGTTTTATTEKMALCVCNRISGKIIMKP